MRQAILICLLVAAGAAIAAERPADFAYGIPLEADGKEALYEVTMPASAYRGVVRSDLGDVGEIGGHAIERRRVELHVARVEDRAVLGVDGHCHTVVDRVRHAHEFELERPELHRIVLGHDLDELGVVDQAEWRQRLRSVTPAVQPLPVAPGGQFAGTESLTHLPGSLPGQLPGTAGAPRSEAAAAAQSSTPGAALPVGGSTGGTTVILGEPGSPLSRVPERLLPAAVPTSAPGAGAPTTPYTASGQYPVGTNSLLRLPTH